MNPILKLAMQLIDIILVPLVFISAIILKRIRKMGIKKLPLCKKTLFYVGVFPIRDHYYEPIFNMQHLKKSLSQERTLSGITWNFEAQLDLLTHLQHSDELKNIPSSKQSDLIFHFNNNTFESGDAEYWYQLIRYKKPTKIIEIGSGYSTLLARAAIKKNLEEGYDCEHICIEPYEMPWLEKTGATIIRNKVENVDIDFFSCLKENDILFIDSSHIIRPQGDVLFEYLELLPTLNKGVIVHIHDIFSPRDYLTEWLINDIKFWNEQYLLEAFLSHNKDWEIIGSLNALHHSQFDKLRLVCPYLTTEREPGSFYIQKIT